MEMLIKIITGIIAPLAIACLVVGVVGLLIDVISHKRNIPK